MLYRIYASTREAELAALPWNAAVKEAFLRMQFSAQDSHYRTACPRARFDLVVRGDEVLGRFYVDRTQQAWLVLDIALLPAHQGQGIGTRLLAELLSEATAAAKPVRLHVERFNPVQRLYSRLGFHEIADEGVYLLLEWNPGPIPQGDRVWGEHAYPNTAS